MIRTLKVIFCDNDHGCGDVTFPELTEISSGDLIDAPALKELRERAHKEGWRRIKGRDLCPDCAEFETERRFA